MPEQQEFSEDMSGLSNDERHLERLLASLVPHESRVSRDRVMFLAGQAAGGASRPSAGRRLSRWIWPAASVCSTCAGLLIGVSLNLGHRDGGGRIAEGPQAPAERLSTTTSEAIAGAPHSSAQSAGDFVTREQSTSKQPADSADEKIEAQIELFRGSSFPQLALRDRMLAGHFDELVLAQVDESLTHATATTELERPIGARKLLQRWIANESSKPR
jgi:hypothetical protein